MPESEKRYEKVLKLRGYMNTKVVRVATGGVNDNWR